MARPSQHNMKKRQREVERLEKAKRKMARRQGKKDKTEETSATDTQDQS